MSNPGGPSSGNVVSLHGIRANVDPVLAERIAARERRLDNQANVAAFSDPQNRAFAIVEPENQYETDSVVPVAEAGTNILTDEFDPENARGSMERAMKAVNDTAGQLGRRITGVFARPYRTNTSEWRMVTGSIGGNHAYLFPRNVFSNRVQHLTETETTGTAFDGSSEALQYADIQDHLLEQEDRFALVSRSVEENVVDGGLNEQQLVDASNSRDLDVAASTLLGYQQASGDKVVIVGEILTATQAHERSQAQGRISSVTGVGAVATGAATARTATSSSVRGTRVWGKGPRATLRDYLDERRAVREAKYGQGATSTGSRSGRIRDAYYKAGNVVTMGLATIAYNKEKYYQKMYKGYVDKGWTDDQLIRSDIERRRARRGGIMVGAFALGLAAYTAGRYFHMDVMPSKFDGDGSDYWPTHGTTSAHAYSHGDMRDGGMSGWLLDDDNPTLPNPHKHVVTTSPPPPDSTPPPPPPAPGLPEHFGIGNGGSYRKSIHDYAHHVLEIPQNNFDDTKSGVVDQIMERRYGPDYVTYVQAHSGPDTYTISPGNTGLRYTGEAFWDPDKAQFMRKVIMRLGSVPNGSDLTAIIAEINTY